MLMLALDAADDREEFDDKVRARALVDGRRCRSTFVRVICRNLAPMCVSSSLLSLRLCSGGGGGGGGCGGGCLVVTTDFVCAHVCA